jgi:hypothetical protein
MMPSFYESRFNDDSRKSTSFLDRIKATTAPQKMPANIVDPEFVTMLEGVHPEVAANRDSRWHMGERPAGRASTSSTRGLFVSRLNSYAAGA